MAIFKLRWMRAAVVVAAVCMSGQASAQVAPVQYWLPGGLFGLGGSWADAGRATTYPNFPGFDAGYASDGDWKANFRSGAFIRSATGGLALNGLGLDSRGLDSQGLNGLGQSAAS